jgi:hypothetical protein
MQWFYPLQDLHEANIRAERAEKSGSWHVVVQQRLYCLERSQSAQDRLAICFFASKLSAAYLAMKMGDKAAFYKRLALS